MQRNGERSEASGITANFNRKSIALKLSLSANCYQGQIKAFFMHMQFKNDHLKDADFYSQVFCFGIILSRPTTAARLCPPAKIAACPRPPCHPMIASTRQTQTSAGPPTTLVAKSRDFLALHQESEPAAATR